MFIHPSDPDQPRSFEAAAKDTEAFWSARWLAQALGYDDLESFRPAIDSALSACALLDIPTADHFRVPTITGIDDMKLSRFAAYLVVMNADSGKKQVAQAQVYLAGDAAFVSSTRRMFKPRERDADNPSQPPRTRPRKTQRR